MSLRAKRSSVFVVGTDRRRHPVSPRLAQVTPELGCPPLDPPVQDEDGQASGLIWLLDYALIRMSYV